MLRPPPATSLGHFPVTGGTALLAITLIGIPFAWAHVKLALASLFPIGKTVVEIDELKLVMRDSGHHGMITFDQCMFKMYKEGKISYDDALRHADSANEVRLMIKLDEGGDAESLAKGLEGVEVLGDDFRRRM